MRTLTLALLTTLALGAGSTAGAADLDYGVLRGPDYEPAAPIIDWNGVYVGGHGGYTSAALQQKNVFQDILALQFRARDIESQFSASNLLAIPSTRIEGTSYGAFAGFNYQFDEAVVGIEADYTRFNRTGVASNGIGRIMMTSGGIAETVNLFGESTTKIEDYGTIRARGGWSFGSFLPFVTGGVAIGRAIVTDQVLVQNYGYDARTYAANQALTAGAPAYVSRHDYLSFNPAYPGVQSSPNGALQTVPAAPVAISKGPTEKIVGGIALGAGMEYALTQNILLRAEYQYVLFNDFDGHKVNLNTVRGGAAVKF
ncbi:MULTISPECIES: outer membrane protein [unclassified Methylobacterium]|jgi:opacity protein-like surface antigen|uniref:outer membrane protein n=1 Tax=unclassified Methylobacterium TaxID=2615210 RepID=UPI0007002764|nr:MULTISPECIES: outer membrane beta-barrel protein [unclassified Methylobacterium]KQO72550.1 porin [Methylobacterium sp. Leaf87]KQP24173.1 porin [Methylobacterium sp. Leaf100]KQP60288.1 porin [Methylobacterium sp. Leaf112]